MRKEGLKMPRVIKKGTGKKLKAHRSKKVGGSRKIAGQPGYTKVQRLVKSAKGSYKSNRWVKNDQVRKTDKVLGKGSDANKRLAKGNPKGKGKKLVTDEFSAGKEKYSWKEGKVKGKYDLIDASDGSVLLQGVDKKTTQAQIEGMGKSNPQMLTDIKPKWKASVKQEATHQANIATLKARQKANAIAPDSAGAGVARKKLVKQQKAIEKANDLGIDGDGGFSNQDNKEYNSFKESMGLEGKKRVKGHGNHEPSMDQVIANKEQIIAKYGEGRYKREVVHAYQNAPTTDLNQAYYAKMDSQLSSLKGVQAYEYKSDVAMSSFMKKHADSSGRISISRAQNINNTGPSGRSYTIDQDIAKRFRNNKTRLTSIDVNPSEVVYSGFRSGGGTELEVFVPKTAEKHNFNFYSDN